MKILVNSGTECRFSDILRGMRLNGCDTRGMTIVDETPISKPSKLGIYPVYPGDTIVEMARATRPRGKEVIFSRLRKEDRKFAVSSIGEAAYEARYFLFDGFYVATDAYLRPLLEFQAGETA